MIERGPEIAASEYSADRARAALLHKKERLEEELKHLGVKIGGTWEATGSDRSQTEGETDSPEPDPIDRAVKIEALEERSAETNSVLSSYNAIMKGLKAIEDGRYGICSQDGKDHPIEAGRLRATEGAATTCIAHKSI